MKKRTLIYRGTAAATAFLMLITVSASTLMFKNAGVINEHLNVRTSKTIQLDDMDAMNTDYYTSEFGTDYTNKQQALRLEMAVAIENRTQAEEGTVLLKNSNDALPLKENTGVTIFGNSSKTGHFSSTVDTIETITFASAMQKVMGEENVNTSLIDNVYAELGVTSSSEVVEASVADIQKYKDTWESKNNDAALVVFSRDGGEDKETAFYAQDGSHFLGLQKEERELIEYLQKEKDAGIFKKIVAVISSCQMMELEWLEEYDIDACILITDVGVTGYEGVANVLTGKVNPSGKVVDTYAANSLSAPAVTYAGENTQVWANVEEVNEKSSDYMNGGETIDNYVIYAEGIYVGYKYYETRYEDTVLNSGNADSTVGSSTGETWNYTEEVVYPFGYGLSYTTFEQKIKSVNYDPETDNYNVEVEVTNTGTTAGKSVVEVYAQTPYGVYEQENGIEKSAIQLVGFEKTETLEPNAAETVNVEVNRYFLSSYDAKNAKGYVLSKGDYYLAIGEDAHDALNNVLAAKGYSTEDGMTAEGNEEKIYTWNLSETDTESYAVSKYTGAEVTNQFDTADLNYYGVEFEYLSRSDWENTYPQEAKAIMATDAMIADLNSDFYERPESPEVSEFTQAESTGLQFIDMRAVDYDDDESWNQFLNGMTVEEMAGLLKDSQGVAGVESINLPTQVRSNDNSYAGTLVATGKKSLRWVDQVTTSRTWNKERFTARGHYIGIESAFCGKNENWYGGGNLHRTPFAGRNWQYYSEDGNFGYIIGAYEAKAMQEAGILYCIKHFAMNDQETHRQGLSTFASEQAIREIYLRAFEGAFCEGGALSTMLSLGRIGVTYTAVHPTLINNVLRGEWGFKGRVTTDGFNGSNSYMNHYMEMFEAGVDYFCLDTGFTAEAITAAIEDGDGNMLANLRRMTKNNIYPITQSTSVNGLNSNSVLVTIVPWWQKAMLVATTVFAVMFVFSTIGCVAGIVKREENDSEEVEKNE